MAGGQSVTVSAGFLSVPKRSGQAASLAAGTIATALTLALVGSAVAGGTGSLTAVNGTGGNLTLTLTGTASTVSAGTLQAPGGQALTGVASTTGIGTLRVVLRPTDISNPAISVGQGALTALGNDVTVNISGVEADFALGFVAGGFQFISGQPITSGAGSPAARFDVPLSGSAFASATGTVVPNQVAPDTLVQLGQGATTGSVSVALVGGSSTGAQGALGITADASAALSGAASTFTAGAIGPEKDFALTGQVVTSALQSVGAPGGSSLTGTAVSAIAGSVFITPDRSFPITGQSVSVIDGLAVTSYLAFATGQVLSVGQQSIGPRSAALTGALFSAQTGFMSADGGDPPFRPPGAPGYGGKKRKRIVVPIGKELTEFPTPEAAVEALNHRAAEEAEKRRQQDDDDLAFLLANL